MSVTVVRQSAWNSTRTRKAALELRRGSVSIPAPGGSGSGAPPVRFNAIEAWETKPLSDGSPPILWRLLTTLPVRTSGDVEKVVAPHRLWWRIKDWHRVLKSGCRVEEIAHRKRERVERALAINAVIAWRITALTELGRTEPGLPAGKAFSDAEHAMLAEFARERGRPSPDSLGSAFDPVAMMGGYLNRGNEARPRNEILWNGHSAL